jgi:hypothetical protein
VLQGKELVDAALDYMRTSGVDRFANAKREQAFAIVNRFVDQGHFVCVAVEGKPFKDTKTRLYTTPMQVGI